MTYKGQFRCAECGCPLETNHYDYCDECAENDGKDEDFYIDQRERELEQRAGACTCGAWQMTKTGQVIHVADCCCGAE